MCIVHLLIYLCVNLPQAVSFPPQLRIDWDLSRRIPLVAEGELEPAVVGCSVAAPLLFHAAPLQFCNPGRRAEARPGLSGVGSLTTISSVPAALRRDLRRHYRLGGHPALHNYILLLPY